MTLDDPFREHPRQSRRGGREEGVHHGERSAAVGLEVRSGVEAEPAHPQQGGADHGHGQRVRSHQLLAVAGALADDEGADKAGDTGIDVHHRAACEVQRALLEDEAAVCHHFVELGLSRSLRRTVSRRGKSLDRIGDRIRTGPVPDHVSHREVDQRHPQRNEQRDGREFRAFSKCTNEKRRRDGCEGELEAEIHHLADVGIDAEGACRRIGGHGRHEGFRESADELGPAGESEAVTVNRPDNGDDADGVEHLSQHREHVLGADEAAVEQCEAGNGHQQHEDCGCHNPGVIALVHRRRGMGGRCGKKADCESCQSRAGGTLERHLV